MSPELDLRRRRRRRPRPIHRATGLLGCLTVVGLLALTLPPPFGARLGVTTVADDAMLPSYAPGDVVLTWRSGDYRPGAPIRYAVPSGEPGADVVVRRVIEVTWQGYRTQGDRQLSPDPWLTTEAEVQGRVVLSLPRAAVLPLGLAAGAGTLALLVLASARARRRRRARPS